ncbi:MULTISPECIES: hypothetical protein [Bacillus]|uniref:Cardiolipin synthase N-terminal domain-containing protein n=1 Tax=Bacillus luti TaxID=2026191 RepID=A0A7V7V3G0_9BACI|nr:MULTISPECIES: hypothetical protein [Bacillus]KAA6461489.1 hypothetical protein DX930_23665 [Bacillus cereus]KAA6469906.1 hypothetical protein DX931_29405 [Bacillus cereus]KAB2414152.1 hypothetical protein F8169_27745 [Bacillus cereus]KAB2434266.1 hypothetical protein F8166_22540 [Bacillus cereus]KAB2439847.1 hypothetical protein F8163_27925 [Bacillus luti]
MIDQLFIVGIYLLIIFMCTYITLEYQQHKMSRNHYVVWLVAVFLTGPFGFLLYLLCGKRYNGL